MSRPFISQSSGSESTGLKLLQTDSRYVNEPISENLDMNNHKISNLKDGENDQDAVTLKQFNTRIADEYSNLETSLRNTDSDTNMNNNKITSVKDATDLQDAMNYRSVKSLINKCFHTKSGTIIYNSHDFAIIFKNSNSIIPVSLLIQITVGTVPVYNTEAFIWRNPYILIKHTHEYLRSRYNNKQYIFNYITPDQREDQGETWTAQDLTNISNDFLING
jgi:hypothetical protein